MKTSIGLPFYNAETTLADAIKSVFAQTVEDWELILMDDGSTDRSLEVARSVRDPRVRVHRHCNNQGLSVRLNEIAQLARAPYLARMDADDMMHPERLAKQLEVLDKNAEVDFVASAIYSLDRSDRPRGKRGVRTPDLTPIGVLKQCPFIHPTITARTDWFRRNPYRERCRRSEDRELYVRTFRDLSWAHLTEPLYFCREERSVRLGKYLGSCRDDRMMFLEYGPSLVGWPRTAALWLSSGAKGEVYRVVCAAGLEHLLVRRRNEPVTEEEARVAMQVLDRIAGVFVPGLSLATEPESVAC